MMNLRISVVAVSAFGLVAGFIATPATGQVPTPLAGRPQTPLRVWSVVYSADGKYLAAAAGNRGSEWKVIVWDIARRAPLWNYTEKKSMPEVAFAPDGKSLAVASYDNAVKVFETTTGKQITILPHPKGVRSLCYSADGKHLATAGLDGKIRLWDLDRKTEKLIGVDLPEMIGVAVSPDASRVVATSYREHDDEGADLWDTATGKKLQTLKHGSMHVHRVIFSPDGKWIFTTGYESSVRIWDARSGLIRARITSIGTDDVAFSPAGHTVAVCSDGQVWLFDLPLREPTPAENEQIRMLLTKLDDDSYEARETAARDLARMGFIAEAALGKAMTESASAEVRIRCRRVREEILGQRRRLAEKPNNIDALAFSPDGKILVTGGMDGIIRLWDYQAGKEIYQLTAN